MNMNIVKWKVSYSSERVVEQKTTATDQKALCFMGKILAKKLTDVFGSNETFLLYDASDFNFGILKDLSYIKCHIP